ncbi:unnamed protein product [Caenorhabditis brenneri]
MWITFVLLIFIIFVPKKSISGFEEDLQKIIKAGECESHCTFNHSEITSKTIKYFPIDCNYVCGILTFNSNTDLSESQLKTAFKSIREITGGLIIENSSLTNLSFFTIPPKLKELHFICETFGLSIVNNSLLKDVSILQKFNFWGDEVFEECPFRIENNPELDASDVCENEGLEHMFGIRISGNRRDCECRGNMITVDSLYNYQNCSTLHGGLNMTNFSNSSDSLNFLSKVSLIRGDIEIQRTDLIDLSFLKKLTRIEVKHEIIDRKAVFNIHDNPEMISFGIKNLEILYNIISEPFIVNFEKLHPDFCLTFQEVFLFLHQKTTFKNIHAKYCQDFKEARKNGFDVCEFQTMSSLKDYCEYIFGDVVIDSYDGRYLYKLFNVIAIFGSLKIQYTKLDGLDFLSGLYFVASLNDTHPAILIRSNKYLKEAHLPNLRSVIARNGEPVVIYDNPELFKTNQECLMYRVSYQANIRVKNGDCGKHMYKRSDFNKYSFSIIIIFGMHFQ